MRVDVRPESYDAPVVQALVQEMADDLAPLYGARSYPPQDPSRWSEPDGAMLVAYVDGEPAGCGGIVRFADATAELKRMYTRPRFRRGHVARHLLSALEDAARRLGYRRLVLETGAPQQAARTLYVTAGYQPVPCWPPFDDDPTSVCLGRDLDGPPAVRQVPQRR